MPAANRATVDEMPAAAAAPTPALPLAEIAGHVLRSLPLAVWVFDRGLRLMHRNDAAATLLAGSGNVVEILAKGTMEGCYQDWETDFRKVLSSGQPARWDNVVLTKAGDEECLLNLTCTPLTEQDGNKVIGAVLIAEDITRRAGLEKRLAVSERLAAVGRLAAKVAHELNNPLDGILRYINLSTRLLDGGDASKVPGYLAESRKGLIRMAQIIGELLEFSRSSHPYFDALNINRTVEEAVRTLQDKAGVAGVTVTLDLREEGMPSLRGGMLYQVCCNLLKNAIDAMPDGGRLTVTTGLREREVVLRFEDTGIGLPEDIERIFEPFFTTKKPGQGTGLGLAICKDYIERLRGRILAERNQPQGAVFTVSIPLSGCVPTNPPAKESSRP